MSYRLRLRFKKRGASKYISHLDLVATMTRAMRRAGLRLEYSQGFNPHPYLSVAIPLPVGCSSECELMDFAAEIDLLPEGLAVSLNKALPDGLEITDVYPPIQKFSNIKWIEVCGSLIYDAGLPPDAMRRITERFTMGNIQISKKTKRGVSDIDIAPFIRDIEVLDDIAYSRGDNAIPPAYLEYPIENQAFARGTELFLRAKLSAQEPSVSTDNLISALDGEFSDLLPDFASFVRIEVFDGEMNVFK